MPGQAITVTSLQLLDYHVSLTRGIVEPNFRWLDSVGSTERIGPAISLPALTGYQQANGGTIDTAICALTKTALAARQGVSVADLVVVITPLPVAIVANPVDVGAESVL